MALVAAPAVLDPCYPGSRTSGCPQAPQMPGTAGL